VALTPKLRVGICFSKIPEHGTLVPKHVGDGTYYGVSCHLFYCILISAFCGLNMDSTHSAYSELC